MPNLTDAELHDRFRYHPPTLSKQHDHDEVRVRTYEFAGFLNELLPAGRESALALTALEEVLMWANKSIARRVDHSGEPAAVTMSA